MTSANLLLIAVLLPLVGVVAIALAAPYAKAAARWIALGTTLLTFGAVIAVVVNYLQQGGEELTFTAEWFSTRQVAINFSLGLDGLGLWLFALSSLLMITAVLVSWEAIRDREPLFYGMLLLLTSGCLGVFTAQDIMLFYVFFEFTLIPLFFLIGIWGSEDRRYAAIKFFLFTLAGSVLTFLGLIALVIAHGRQVGVYTFSIPELTTGLSAIHLPITMQVWIFLALFAGFSIKVPLFPLHTWLPLAHVQAPTAGSVILAGLLLKIGGYGFLRFSIPMLPDATAMLAPYVLWLAVIGIVYGALVALAQSDMKKLIAYSSVSHLGFCLLGLFALNPIGVQGGALQMINHGISTGGLFAVIGMLYERYHTREIKSLGGLARKLPVLSFFMVVFTMSSIGLPGTNGFAGEFLVLLGMFQRGYAGGIDAGLDWQLMLISVIALSGVVLGAWYMLQLVQNVFFGPLKEPSHEGHGEEHSDAGTHEIADASWREIAALAPLCVFVLWIGLYPKFFLDPMAPATNAARSAAAQSWDAVHSTEIVQTPEQLGEK